ncbi:MAG TPA: hypothetical protein VFQ45_23000 [Longimicrobium sp.]|nr:hypothetical protein [Longimicrobium sp.]
MPPDLPDRLFAALRRWLHGPPAIEPDPERVREARARRTATDRAYEQRRAAIERGMREAPARIAAEFAPEDRAEAEALMRGFLARDAAESAGVWEDVLDMAGGDLHELRQAITLAQTDWRDAKVGAAATRCLLELMGRPPRPGAMRLGPEEEARIRRDFAKNRALAERYFPRAELDEVMLAMGASWPASAEDVLRLANGSAARLRWLWRAPRAGDADPSTLEPLADLPFPAAELIRRDFDPADWARAAAAAARVPEKENGLLNWLLLAEYAGGDPARLEQAVRLLRDDYFALTRGVADRRQARRAAGEDG